MKVYIKLICVMLVALMFFGFVIYLALSSIGKEHLLTKVKSPIEFILDDNTGIKFGAYTVFDSEYSMKNKELAKQFGVSEDEAFIIGNFGKYWAANLLEGRKIRVENQDILYNKFGYIMRFENSAFCIKDGELCNKSAFEKELSAIRHRQFVIRDLDTDTSYPVSEENWKKVKNFVVVRKTQVKDIVSADESEETLSKSFDQKVLKSGNIKLIISDFTTKLIPDRSCSSEVCKELLKNINNADSSIDVAIYGYSSTPVIEQAFKNAVARGVKVRIVYDIDSKDNNIYPDTFDFISLISDSVSDKSSSEVRYSMHNKFYIFDNKIVITGSANLSHTDMSGYNTNSVLVIDSKDVASIYEQEFEQMYSGNFHNSKQSYSDKSIDNMQIFFSPQDKAVANGIIPLVKGAKDYIYIPVFVITEKRLTQELINAKKRGVDVKVIVDALNASTEHSKHKELRSAGIPVKAENYAGKMHSKTMIVDDEFLVVGSMNFSNSGENRNDENVVILKNAEAAKFYKDFFLYQWDKIPEEWLKYTPRAEGKDSIGSCSDGIDNDYDGKIDMEDEACKEALSKKGK